MVINIKLVKIHNYKLPRNHVTWVQFTAQTVACRLRVVNSNAINHITSEVDMQFIFTLSKQVFSG